MPNLSLHVLEPSKSIKELASPAHLMSLLNELMISNRSNNGYYLVYNIHDLIIKAS